VVSGVGTAAGNASVTGVSEAIKQSAGTIAGTSTVHGEPEGTSNSVGTIAGTATVTGVSVPRLTRVRVTGEEMLVKLVTVTDSLHHVVTVEGEQLTEPVTITGETLE
jgi:hypothetical protein